MKAIGAITLVCVLALLQVSMLKLLYTLIKPNSKKSKASSRRITIAKHEK